MRVIVTGGAGFIGSHVTDRLVDDGHEVIVIDNLDPAAHSGPPDYLRDDVDYRVADVRDIETWRSALDGVDAIAHLAGKVGLGVDFGDCLDYVDHNDRGTATGLAALHQRGWSGRFVLASSMVVYGEGRYLCDTHGDVRPGPRRSVDLEAGDFEPPCPLCGAALRPGLIDEGAPCEPRNVYAATKLHQEHLLSAYASGSDVTHTSLRFHNVYGPRMPSDTPYAGVASIFLSELAAGRAPRVFEDGGQLRDFVHVSDVARAVVASLASPPEATGTFNVASGTATSIGGMATRLAAAVDPRLEPEIVGGWRDGDVRHVLASPDRLRDVLGVEALIDIDTGMSELAGATLRHPPSGDGDRTAR